MRLSQMFSKTKGAAFMPYVCCGDPNPEFTLKLAKALAQNGADAIELGIPFSDPIADGKSVQAASARALVAGMTPKKAIGIIGKLRKEGIGVPIVAMTYYNIPFSFGEEKFAVELKKAGAQGLIVPDVPIDECGPLSAACRKAGLDLVQLATPNCSDGRLRKIAARTKGFLYAVSVVGITGARGRMDARAIRLVKRAKRMGVKVAAGFGISSPAQAREFEQAGADGVIVGSRLADLYSRFISGKLIGERRALAAASKFAREMKRACLG